VKAGVKEDKKPLKLIFVPLYNSRIEIKM